MTIEQRVAKLERQNRRMKRVGGVMLAVINHLGVVCFWNIRATARRAPSEPRGGKRAPSWAQAGTTLFCRVLEQKRRNVLTQSTARRRA